MISINILSWNTYKTLNETMKIVWQELKGQKFEIIVVDNGSTDGTQEFIREWELAFPGKIKGILNEENLGISKGKNQGVDASKGDLILLLDGDIIPVPGSINCLINFLRENWDIDAIGFLPNKYTNQINKHGQKHHEELCKVLFEPHIHDSHCVYFGLYRNSVFGRCRFFEDGPFAEPGYGWEDFDFYQQMKMAGIDQWVAGINNAAGKYYHAINSSIQQLDRGKFREMSIKRKELYDQRWSWCLTK